MDETQMGCCAVSGGAAANVNALMARRCGRRLKPGLREIREGIDMPRGANGRGLDVNKCGKRHGDEDCGQQQRHDDDFDTHAVPSGNPLNTKPCSPFPRTRTFAEKEIRRVAPAAHRAACTS
jgi:hypothetical protein